MGLINLTVVKPLFTVYCEKCREISPARERLPYTLWQPRLDAHIERFMSTKEVKEHEEKNFSCMKCSGFHAKQARSRSEWIIINDRHRLSIGHQLLLDIQWGFNRASKPLLTIFT
jgi:hypothetical protein